MKTTDVGPTFLFLIGACFHPQLLVVGIVFIVSDWVSLFTVVMGLSEVFPLTQKITVLTPAINVNTLDSCPVRSACFHVASLDQSKYFIINGNNLRLFFKNIPNISLIF